MARPLSDLPPGITATATGYRVFQWVPWPGYPDGRVFSKRFSRRAGYEPTIRECQAWQDERRVEARKRKLTAADASVPVGEGFLADADRYLEAVKTMPTWNERRRHMIAWCAVFGEQASLTITSTPIRTQCERWRTVGPKMVLVKPKSEKARWEPRPIPLAPHSVNLRLRALENFFTVLYPDADNPVHEVPEYEEPAPQPKGQSFALAYEILSFMPDVTKAVKGDARERGSLSRIRFETMLVTGLEAKQLGLLAPDDVNWSACTVAPPTRHKGRRSRRHRASGGPKPRQLMPFALPVLRRFFAMGANHPFSASALRQSVHRAIHAANRARAAKRRPLIPIMSTKALTRHTFGTEVFRQGKDLRLVQELLGHSDIEQSAMYAAAAVQEHQVAAVADLSRVAARAKRDVAAALARPSRRPYHGKVSPPPAAHSVRTGRSGPARKAQ